MQKPKSLSLKALVMMAMLTALSIVLGKYLAVSVGELLRFSFENLPIIFAGIAFGPLGGALVGAAADLIGCVLVGYAINPLVTLGALAIGLLSGGIYRLVARFEGLPLWLSVALTVGISHIIGSVIIKTFGLSAFYSVSFGVLLLWRLLNYLIVGGLEAVLICVLLKNKRISTELSHFSHKGSRKDGVKK